MTDTAAPERADRPRLRIGVDAGGTFTDVSALDETSGRQYSHKVPSTPDDPSRAVVQGVAELLADVVGDAGPESVAFFAHGSTVATNALLEKKGARTGLITTEGFRDLLEIARQRRPSLYDLTVEKPPALVRRRHRLEVPERLDHTGAVVREPSDDDLRDVVKRLADLDLEAVAVCLLYSYVNPDHERRLAALLAELAPELYVSVSHEVVPEFREYERMSTTVLSSYVGPKVGRYLGNLQREIAALGITADVHITQSNGGIISLDAARAQPARMMLSGPSTGLVAAAHIGELIGEPNLITFDMGGTSTDAALVHGGRAELARDAEIDGYPIRTPMLDITTVGAGGGSIARIDSGGALKVGPSSAGAEPGPACYGRQREFATVTDANVVLGTQNPKHLLGGRLPIDASASRAVVGALAAELGLDQEYTADGIVRVVTANMAKAIRVVSVQRGHDVRDYSLVAFGGAGPLHAARLARELGIGRIVVPPSPGVMCAFGLMVTELRTDLSVTRMLPVDPDAADELDAVVRGLRERAGSWFAGQGVPEGERELRVSVDMRYVGQNHELTVPFPVDGLDAAAVANVLTRFAAQHEELYGFSVPGDSVQAVTFRAEAIGRVHTASVAPAERAESGSRPAPVGHRIVHFGLGSGRIETPVHDRERLRVGHEIAGPAVVEQMDSTTVVLPGQIARVDGYANLIIEEETP